jgi:hypothetical protein
MFGSRGALPIRLFPRWAATAAANPQWKAPWPTPAGSRPRQDEPLARDGDSLPRTPVAPEAVKPGDGGRWAAEERGKSSHKEHHPLTNEDCFHNLSSSDDNTEDEVRDDASAVSPSILRVRCFVTP